MTTPLEILRCGDVRSVSRITCTRPVESGPDVLFIADWRGARVFAFELEEPGTPALPEDTKEPYIGIEDLQGALPADLRLGEMSLEDIAVRPGSEDVFVALSVGPDKKPLIVVARRDGSVEPLLLGKISKVSSASLADPVDAEFQLWPGIKGRTFTVSDLCFHKGKLYIAGVSNTDFRSTLRVLDYPLSGSSTNVAVEMYHMGHRRTETRAPIRAMTILELGPEGKKEDYIVAGYLCTPVVIFPLARITAALGTTRAVTGKTIGELGAGGIPFAIIAYDAPSGPFDPTPIRQVLVANELRQSVTMPRATLDTVTSRSVAGFTDTVSKGLNGWEGSDRPGEQRRMAGFYSEQTAGLTDVQLQYVYRADYLDKRDHLVTLRRNLQTGKAEVMGVSTMLMLRMSDWHPREYDWALPGEEQPASDPKYWTPRRDNAFDMLTVQIYNTFKDKEGIKGYNQWYDAKLLGSYLNPPDQG